MEQWSLFYQTWVILGIVFILLELVDGSNIFFLPLGVGSLLVSIYLYLSVENLVTEFLILDLWYEVLVLWVVLSVSVSVFIAKFWKKKSDINDDINNY
jgi:membrane protein implicated in regulation of membrane protease activity